MRESFIIRRLGHKGDGIADGPVFVPRSLPGEKISGIRNGDQLTDVRIETPSENRVRPDCRHYSACGGCQLQHANDEFVVRWKQEIVSAALAAQGLTARFRDMHVSPPGSRRRATLSARRTRKGALAGFHARASGVIIEIPDCRLLTPALIGGLAEVERLSMRLASRKSELSVSLTESQAGLDMSVSAGRPLDGALRAALGGEVGRGHIARLSVDGETVAVNAPPVQSFDGIEVLPPPGAFLQATRQGEATIVSAVSEAIAGATRIVDLFSGCGTIGLPVAKFAEVHAVEGDKEMSTALYDGWRGATGLKPVTVETRDLFRRPLDRSELSRFDAAILDPPRAGAEAQVTELAASPISRVAYVSCNPVTFARDAARLVSAGFDISWVKVVDQFRWSFHTELVALFGR